MSSKPKIVAIWAQDHEGVIGSGSGMLWRVPSDLQHFKSATTGSPVIMGRHSWEALGQALPNRLNIVITRQEEYKAPGAMVANSLEEAISLAKKQSPECIWIAGGSQIYNEALDKVDELVISQLDLIVDPDGPVVHAPAIALDTWRVDESRSDPDWRPISGDARWRQVTYVRR